MRRRAGRWLGPALVATLAASLAGCGAGSSSSAVAGTPASSTTRGASGTPAPSGTLPPSATPGPASTPASSDTPAPSGSLAPSATASPSASPVAVDPTLLSLLPRTVGGRPILETPDAERSTAADPSVARAAQRLALGYVASANAADWAIASVVELRPGIWSEAFYRDWRDSYDAAICAAHGGVAGNAQATIAGRVVDIATCGPLRTYHVHLAARDVIVSVASVGDGRYGELVMAGLRP